jgi:dipeptidyl aminopeptidase/acylaminoacyl peptidase
MTAEMGATRASEGRTRAVRRLVATGLVMAGGAAGAYAVASYLAYDAMSRVPGRCWPRDRANSPGAYVVPNGFDQAVADANRLPEPELVEFPPRDPSAPGLALRGWWIPGPAPSAPAVIVVHGIRSCRREANVLVPAGMLHRNGFGVLAFDLRNHGDSDDANRRHAAAVREHRDVLGAWDWVASRGVPPHRIGILGVSFGAACALIAGGEDPRIAAVWADSSWTDVDQLLGRYLAMAGRPRGLGPGVIAMARIVAGDDLRSLSPLVEVTRYRGRALAIVHGGSDPDLPPAFARTLRSAAQAAGNALVASWIVPGAGHTEAAYLRPVEYEARLTRFFGQALGVPSGPPQASR